MREQPRCLRIRTVRPGALVLLAIAFVLGLAAWGRWTSIAQGQSQGCAVYPIALHEDILAGAQPGDIFPDIENGVGAGEFGWLIWKGGAGQRCPGEPSPYSASSLADRLTYPGNSTTCEGEGTPDECWKGYLNPYDSDADYDCYDPDGDDYQLNVGDWVWGHTGAVSSDQVRDTLDDHVDTGRYLRIPVWDYANCDGAGDECEGDAPGGGANVMYRASGFALVKLLSYNLAAKTITLEFVRWDNSCGQGGGAGACDPHVDLYTSQTGGYGLEQVSNLSIYGPRICTSYGDPYTPYNSPWYDELDGVYPFRLYIPGDYESRALSLTGTWNGGADTNDILRVEIWDPDCYNDPFLGNQFVITNTFTGITMTISNACGSNDRREACVPVLRAQDPQNPFGFVRIDENRGSGTPPGNGQCGQPASYNADYNTVTEYTLYYYRRLGDGSLERRDLARYTKGGADSDSDTDMLWVCPGGSLPDDPPADAGFVPDAGDGNFAIDLNTEVPDIYADPVDGHRSLFLDVRGVEGASENGFDLWAGPRYQTVPSEVNARNVDILLHAGDYHSSAGATFFGIGHLPMNTSYSEVVTHTLTYIPPEWGGRTLYVSTFDNDCGTCGVTFSFDTMPRSDWHYDGLLSGGNVWYTNVFTVPSAEQGYTFYGGFLQAVYEAWGHDTFGWNVRRFYHDLSESTKEASETVISPGEVLTYTIVVNNTGTEDALTASLNDPIPDHTTYVTGSAQVDPPGSGVLTDTASAIEWSGSVAANEATTLTFQVTVEPDVVDGTEITNVVAISDGACEFYREATVLVVATPPPTFPPTPGSTPTPTATPTPTETGTPTETPTVTSTPSCAVEIQEPVYATDTTVTVHGDPGDTIVLRDMDAGGAIIGSGVVGGSGYCNGSVDIYVNGYLVDGHIIAAISTDHPSSDTTCVGVTTCWPTATTTATATSTATSTATPTATPTATSTPTATEPYIVLSHTCIPEGQAADITVSGYNWSPNANKTIIIQWDGDIKDNFSSRVNWVIVISISASEATAGTHTVRASLLQDPYDEDSKDVIIPCPSTPTATTTATPATSTATAAPTRRLYMPIILKAWPAGASPTPTTTATPLRPDLRITDIDVSSSSPITAYVPCSMLGAIDGYTWVFIYLNIYLNVQLPIIRGGRT